MSPFSSEETNEDAYAPVTDRYLDLTDEQLIARHQFMDNLMGLCQDEMSRLASAVGTNAATAEDQLTGAFLTTTMHLAAMLDKGYIAAAQRTVKIVSSRLVDSRGNALGGRK